MYKEGQRCRVTWCETVKDIGRILVCSSATRKHLHGEVPCERDSCIRSGLLTQWVTLEDTGREGFFPIHWMQPIDDEKDWNEDLVGREETRPLGVVSFENS